MGNDAVRLEMRGIEHDLAVPRAGRARPRLRAGGCPRWLGAHIGTPLDTQVGTIVAGWDGMGRPLGAIAGPAAGNIACPGELHGLSDVLHSSISSGRGPRSYEQARQQDRPQFVERPQQHMRDRRSGQ